MDDFVIVYSMYRTVNGRKVYRADGKPFRFKIPRDKYQPDKRVKQ